jgi:thiamine-phosphate pyrophosphorylase
MKLIVITPSKNIESEHYILGKMLDMGLPTLHVRKPKLSEENLKNYLNEFTKSQRKKIIIHTHHNLMMHFELKGIHVSKRHRRARFKFFLSRTKLRLRRGKFIMGTSCKSLSSLDETYADFDYVMISPVFTNPHGHRPSFNHGTLKRIIPTYPGKVIARGGATIDSIEKAKELGFAGIAFQRFLWDNPEPLVNLQKIFDRFSELGLPVE